MEFGALNREDSTVVCRLVHEEHDRIDTAVPSLQSDPSIHGLDIPEASLGLHANRPPIAFDDSIPRAKVGRGPCQARRDRCHDGHLESPAKRRRQTLLQSREEGDVRGIADRRPCWERPGRELEADRCEEDRERDEADLWRFGSADPGDLISGQADRPPELLIAEPR
jgi:hypothetical protein